MEDNEVENMLTDALIEHEKKSVSKMFYSSLFLNKVINVHK